MQTHSQWSAWFRVDGYGTIQQLKAVHIIRDSRGDDEWTYCVAAVDVDSIWPAANDSDRWIEVVW